MTDAEFQRAVGEGVEIYDLPAMAEGGVSVKDQRASDAWLRRRWNAYDAGLERALMQLVLDFDDRIRIGVSAYEMERRSWRRKPDRLPAHW
jgi:hypothetical protein